MIEARGPGGCLLLIEVLTDNNNRSQQDIRRVLNRNGSAFFMSLFCCDLAAEIFDFLSTNHLLIHIVDCGKQEIIVKH